MSKKNQSRLRKLKLKLYRENPRCHYCKQIMVWDDTAKHDGTDTPLLCTLEHLLSKYDPRRWEKKLPTEHRLTLACYACNQNRSVKETMALSRHDVLSRSKGFSLKPNT